MTLIGTILYVIIRIFVLLLIARLVIEMIHSFSRNFQPPRWFSYVAEPIFLVTDPPVKALRRIIPPVRMGGVALDISVIVLFFIMMLLQIVVQVVFLI
ncbi:YGGT family protein [Corynebacterium occultum]|uniref:YGGT family protein n=1 Tax=Corynebacterium occultum TaxID=2675219 RepID=A0A6B8VXL3_9CORY|nr:YggT family protein [Corynebacterium occultum]QGU07799.1 YGGT family protein [Corynebacterium occultum]